VDWLDVSSQPISFADLSDEQLVAEVKRLAGSERRATAVLIRALMELDARRLYLGEGYSSLFTYCTQALHLAEGAAYNRIETARAARRFPTILDGLEDGSLTLTTVRLLAPHLTLENHETVLASAHHKRKQAIEQIVASLNPKPAVPAMIRRLPMPPQGVAKASADLAPTAAEQSPVAEESCRSSRLAVVAPLAPERFRVQPTISRETRDKLDRVQALARHAIPNGDLTTIFDRALTLLLSELERRVCAATPSPRRRRETSDASRHIPAAVKREVWRRDGGRCAFVGRDGRCSERSFLEYHHVLPYAAGGGATTANIELRCKAHNAHEAALFFGSESPP
jgi:hypothetical protein